MLTIVLDLNGLLLKRGLQPSTMHQSTLYAPNKYFILRPGCLKVLQILLERFNVGIWSNAMDQNVIQMVTSLGKIAGAKLPFFVIWGQISCYTYEKKKLFRPDNPGVEAMFKPLAKLSKCYGCDPRRTVLIDDSPYKGCVTPTDNCIFPSKFDLDTKDDDILMGELLPYLMQLDEIEDLRKVIKSNRYGQIPVVYGHELFNLVGDVIEYWKEPNAEWSQTTLHLDRLPPAEQPIEIESSTRTSFGTRNMKSTSRASQDVDMLRDILRKEGPLVPNMKPNQLITLARRLGCKGANLKPQSARAFINRLLNEHGLLDINK